jgi:transglutaminase-like putative cysteine protease
MAFFRIIFSFLLLAATVNSAHAQAVKKVQPSGWITINEVDSKSNFSKEQSGGFYYILLDRQYNLKTEERYFHFAYKILSSEGVQQMSDISVDFDPAYQQLSFHSIIIHRNNKPEDRLQPTDIKTAQREQSMERYLYDGSKTAYFNLADVRVGDIVEYSFTIKGFNPVFEGHFSDYFYFDYSFPYQKLFQRILLPNERNYQLFYRNGEVKPVKTGVNAKEFVWQLENVEAIIMDNNAPSWYDPYRYVVVTDFASWEEVNRWALKQFDFPEAKEKVRALLPANLMEGSMQARVTKAIQFVQDEVRYLGFESGINSHKPHSPEKVLTQRFGDCKDKSLLLSTIIELQGGKAYPVLVNTSVRKKVLDEPSTAIVFNHCVVQYEIDGKTFWVDPTIGNQGGDATSIAFPLYGAGLVLKEGTTNLAEIGTAGVSETIEEQFFELKEIGGAAHLKIKTTYKGYEADWMRSDLSSNTRSATQQSYLSYYGNMYPDIVVKDTMQVTDDRFSNVLIVEESYEIPSMWSDHPDRENTVYCEFYPQSIEKYLNVSKLTQRKAPYRLSYPLKHKHITAIQLPEPWNVENDDLLIASDYYSFERLVRYNNEEIIITNIYQTKQEEVPVEYINRFVEDHQKMMANISFSLTYDKSLATQSSNGITLWIVVLAGLVIGTWLVVTLHKYDPEQPTSDNQSIGGWLILIAIGLCITPIRILIDLIKEDNNFFNAAVWDALVNMKNWNLLTLFAFEMIFNIVFIFFSLMLIIHFFQRRTTVPTLISFFYGVSFAVIFIDALAASAITEAEFGDSFIDILRSMLAAVIWIPYFQMSERVKSTFTVRL